MPEAVHAQPTAKVTEQRRQRVKHGADLCRAQPALRSAMVRYSDQLQAEGFGRDQADDAAWAAYVGR